MRSLLIHVQTRYSYRSWLRPSPRGQPSGNKIWDEGLLVRDKTSTNLHDRALQIAPWGGLYAQCPAIIDILNIDPCKLGKFYNPGFFRYANPWDKKGGHIYSRGAGRLLILLPKNLPLYSRRCRQKTVLYSQLRYNGRQMYKAESR